MEIKEAAKILGDAIQAHPTMQAFHQAKQAYDMDEKLQQFMFEYQTQRKILGDEFKKELSAQDQTLIEVVNRRVSELYSMIVNSETYRAFADAQQNVGKLMNEVNSDINFYVFGERPCTHDCSSCSADCSHNQGEHHHH